MRRAFFLYCLLLSFPLLVSAQFATHVDYATGQTPFAVATGDFNLDGHLDLVVTNQADNTVGILLGNGDGTFRAHVDYATAARPTSVVVGDFNGDGKPDIAVATANANSVSVLLGNGDGTFQPHVEYGADTNDQFLVAADFNGDGKLDLATANYDGGYYGDVSVLLGNGDGTFQSQRIFSAGINPFGIIAGDFNRDGKTDLAVTDNNGSWGVQILLGNGDGTFQQPVWFGAGTNPRVGVVADFNHDGNLDLAIGNCLDNDVSILYGDGNGNFSGPSNYGTGRIVQAVASGDFNLDGKLDLAVTAQSDNSVSVLLGNSDGTFQSHVDYAVGSGPNAVAVGDFNGDGAPDVATANWYVNTVSVLLNASRGTTTTLSGSPNPAAPNQRVIYAASVISQSGETITGTVTFKDGGVGVATVTLQNGLAAWSTRYNKAGLHEITATYSGDANNSGSTSAPLKEVVQASSRTVLTTSGSPSMVGQLVTFTAMVTSKFGLIPDGDPVTFYDGTAALGTAALTGGVAVYTTSSLTAKMHVIKAAYGGDEIFKSSYGSVRQVVNKYSTTTTLHSDLNPSQFRQAVKFTARVSGTAPSTPTGQVAFTDGTTRIGLVTLKNGVATFITYKLAVGTHPITAEYRGDPVSDKSTSNTVEQVVQ